jgi:hypothetical protein
MHLYENIPIAIDYRDFFQQPAPTIIKQIDHRIGFIAPNKYIIQRFVIKPITGPFQRFTFCVAY